MKLVTVTTTGNTIFCANMITSLRMHSNLPIVVYCSSGAKEELENTFDIPNEVELKNLDCEIQEHNSYGTDNFINISFKKIEALRKELEENNCDFTMVDTDVVFEQDPKYLLLNLKINTDYDLVFQTDLPTGQNICTGFFYIRNNEQVKKFLDDYISIIPRMKEIEKHKTEWKELHDQALMNMIFDGRINLNTNVKWTTFPTSIATNGHLYFSLNETSEEEVVIHCNFAVGKRDKLNRLKSKDLWFMGDSNE